MRYLALLRGINVGKSGRVTMAELRAAFTSFGLRDVGTYIQSGNVFFDGPARGVSVQSLEDHLETAIGFKPPVALRTVEALQRTLASSPFAGRKQGPEERFMLLIPTRKLLGQITVPSTSATGDVEIVSASGAEFFAVMHLRNGRPSDPVNFVERTARVPVTGRFLHTMHEIVDAALGRRA